MGSGIIGGFGAIGKPGIIGKAGVNGKTKESILPILLIPETDFLVFSK